MSILDGPMGDLAATLLDSVQLGSRPATIRRPGSGQTHDPITSTLTGGNPDTDYPCRSAPVRFETTQIPESLIQAGDKAVQVARKTIGIEPNPDSDLYIEGPDPDASSAITWEIKGVLPEVTGEEEAAYVLHLRR